MEVAHTTDEQGRHRILAALRNARGPVTDRALLSVARRRLHDEQQTQVGASMLRVYLRDLRREGWRIQCITFSRSFVLMREGDE